MAMAVSVMFTVCGSEKKTDGADSATVAKPKVLVIYYSQTGATKLLADELQKQLGADVEEIVCENPYTGDFNQTIQRCQDEMADNEYPSIKPLNANIGEYDVIFLGYPVWFGTYARPIGGLLRAQSFDGMKIVTFCTFGSGGIEASTKDLQQKMEGCEVIQGFGVRNAFAERDAASVVSNYLIQAGYKEGNIDPLPAFSEHHVCTDEESDIFHEACDGYQFPFGKAVDVASRETADYTEYEFNVISADGSSMVYVTLSKAEGAKAEFTRVVR